MNKSAIAIRPISIHSSGSGTPETLKRSEEHTSELQSRQYLVCRLLLEKKTTSFHTIRLSETDSFHFPLSVDSLLSDCHSALPLAWRSYNHTSELHPLPYLASRLLLHYP